MRVESQRSGGSGQEAGVRRQRSEVSGQKSATGLSGRPARRSFVLSIVSEYSNLRYACDGLPPSGNATLNIPTADEARPACR